MFLKFPEIHVVGFSLNFRNICVSRYFYLLILMSFYRLDQLLAGFEKSFRYRCFIGLIFNG